MVGFGRWRLIVAFIAVYVLWGSTYLSIRVLVATVPPLFAAGLRFLTAGLVLLLWASFRRTPMPARAEWRNLALLGVLMFLFAYGGLFWAEKTLPSGVASVLVATIPVWTGLLEIYVFKRETLTISLASATGLGIAGVSLLTLGSPAGKINLLPCLAVLGAEISWSLGVVLSKSMQLPQSKVLNSGAEMALGGMMLLAASALAGEMHPFPHISREAAWALVYLIVAGSLVAFTAFVWLLGRLPATQVSTYAFVNPVIALAIGHWFAGESLGLTTLLGSGLILSSVVLIMRTKVRT